MRYIGGYWFALIGGPLDNHVLHGDDPALDRVELPDGAYVRGTEKGILRWVQKEESTQA